MIQHRKASARGLARLVAVLITCTAGRVVARASEDPPASFSAARTLAHEGKFQEAEALFKQLDAQSSDAGLATAARCNLGYCLFQRAKAAAGEHSDQALPLFLSASSAYRAALDVSPGESSAARGLEITRQWIKKLKDEMTKDGRSKGEQGQDPNKKDASDSATKQGAPGEDGAEDKGSPTDGGTQEQGLRDLAQEQKQAARDSEGTPNGRSPSLQNKLKEQQADLTKRTEQAKESLKERTNGRNQPRDGAPKDQPPPETDAEKSLENAARAQNEAGRALDEGDTTSAARHQRDAADALQRAADQVGAADQENATASPGDKGQKRGERSGENQGGVRGGNAQQLQQPKRELDPLAKQLLDRERRQRALRQRWLQGQMTKPPAVEKDW